MKNDPWSLIVGLCTILGFIFVIIDFIWRERIQTFRAKKEKNRQAKLLQNAHKKLIRVIELQENETELIRVEIKAYVYYAISIILLVGIWIITTIETIWVNTVELTDKMRHITADDFLFTIIMFIFMFSFFRNSLRDRELIKKVERRKEKYQAALIDETRTKQIMKEYDEIHFGVSENFDKD